MNQDRVFFFDTTLRDGEQSPGCSMTTPEKLRMAHALEALGVDIIEAGFAIASPGDFAAIGSICREVRGPRIASLARTRKEDIEAAAQLEAGRPCAHPRIPRQARHSLGAQAEDLAGGSAGANRHRSSPGAHLRGRCGVLSRRRFSIESGFPLQHRGHGHRRRSDHDQFAGHRRLLRS